jgi:hypothetical protein
MHPNDKTGEFPLSIRGLIGKPGRAIYSANCAIGA